MSTGPLGGDGNRIGSVKGISEVYSKKIDRFKKDSNSGQSHEEKKDDKPSRDFEEEKKNKNDYA